MYLERNTEKTNYAFWTVCYMSKSNLDIEIYRKLTHSPLSVFCLPVLNGTQKMGVIRTMQLSRCGVSVRDQWLLQFKGSQVVSWKCTNIVDEACSLQAWDLNTNWYSPEHLKVEIGFTVC